MERRRRKEVGGGGGINVGNGCNFSAIFGAHFLGLLGLGKGMGTEWIDLVASGSTLCQASSTALKKFLHYRGRRPAGMLAPSLVLFRHKPMPKTII